MQKRVKITVFVTALILAFSPVSVAAVEHRDLTDLEIGIISQNCSSINIQLQRIQKDDARKRVQLGSRYETVATSLMLNLNLRLVKNNIANAALVDQQTEFTSIRDGFKAHYITYSQEFEVLMNTNCRNNPKKFYEQLEVVREKRAIIDDDTKQLYEILIKHKETVTELRDEL